MVAGVGEFFFVFLWDENWLVYLLHKDDETRSEACKLLFSPPGNKDIFCFVTGWDLNWHSQSLPPKKTSPIFFYIYCITLLQRKILFLINVLVGMTSLIKTSPGEKHKRARYKTKNRSDKCGKRYYGKTRWKGRKNILRSGRHRTQFPA